MSGDADRIEPFRVIIDAEEVKGFARAENELTRFLRDFHDDRRKIEALEHLKIRAAGWAKNDISRFLRLRVDRKLQLLRDRAGRGPLRDTKRAA